MEFFKLSPKVMILIAFSASLVFSIGVVIGYYGKEGEIIPTSCAKGLGESSESHRDKGLGTSEFLNFGLRSVSPESIRAYHKILTQEPHIAGLKRDIELTNFVKDQWLANGIDHVDLPEYDLYLSWPNQTNPNKVFLLNEHDEVQYTSRHKEIELRAGDDHPDFVHGFLAYTPPGEVTGQLVFVNYGSVEDLAVLEKFNISLEGKICIARYGKIFRGNKITNCQNHGAIGVVLFSDPAEVAPKGTSPQDVYPYTMYMPGSAIQRGSALISNGDALSPNWPSVANAHRLKEEDADGIPKIPAQPIGYDDAKKFLQKMGGPLPPDSWKGKIEGVDYRLGGEMLPEFRNWNVRIKVNNYYGTVKSSNVIGVITGEVEPDRYVLFGNHRDSWGYGSYDATTGFASMLEIVRVLGELKKKGWRPRRTIVLCNWAAEEYGLLGSREWVEEKKTELRQRAVGYLNMDVCGAGNIPDPATSPVFRDVLIEGLKNSADPTTNQKRSFYDFWQEKVDPSGATAPKVKILGSGSDHASFAFIAGIPSIDVKTIPDVNLTGVNYYPAYHTGYETFYLVDKIIDNSYQLLQSCSQTALHIILNLADSLILPYNLEHFPSTMKEAIGKILEKDGVNELFESHNITLRYLMKAIQSFERSAQGFSSNIEAAQKLQDPMTVRILNDQLMQVERMFLLDEGLPGRPEVKSAIFAPEFFNKYGGSAFPGINDLLHDIHKESQSGKEAKMEILKKHISDLMILIQNAAKHLRNVNYI